MILEYSARQMAKAEKDAKTPTALNLPFDPEAMGKIQSAFWQDGMALWQHFLQNGGESVKGGANSPADKDRRFAAKQWQEDRSEEHTSELQSLMRISYAVFCLKKQKKHKDKIFYNRNAHIYLVSKEENTYPTSHNK